LPPAPPWGPRGARRDRPAARPPGGQPRRSLPVPPREVASHGGGDAHGAGRRWAGGRGGRGRGGWRASVIARALRSLALVLLGLCAVTVLGSLLIGTTAGLPAQRALSGG